MGDYYAMLLDGQRALYHYGVLGQKWGVRRYQYRDGTLTPLGREHYRKSTSKDSKYGDARHGLGKRLKEGIKRGITGKLAEKFPWMLTDEEINEYRDRQNLENTYRRAIADKKRIKNDSRSHGLIEEIARDTAKTAARNIVNNVTSKMGNKLGDQITKSDQEKREEYMKREASISKEKLNASNNRDIDRTIRDMASKADNNERIRDLKKEKSGLSSKIESLEKFIRDNGSSLTNDEKSQYSYMLSAYKRRATKTDSDIDKLKRKNEDLDRAIGERRKQIAERKKMMSNNKEQPKKDNSAETDD